MEESLRFARALPIQHESCRAIAGRVDEDIGSSTPFVLEMMIDPSTSSRALKVLAMKKRGHFEQKPAFTCNEHASIQELVQHFIRCAGGVNSKGAKFMASQSPGQKKTVQRVMHEYKHGELKAGRGRRGKVKNPKQAIAIALHEAGASNQESPAENKRSLARTKRRERAGKTAASSGRKTSRRKTTGRKTASRSTTRSASARKPSARSSTSRKSTPSKSTARKPSARKSTARKSPARRSTPKKRRTASRSTTRSTRRKSTTRSTAQRGRTASRTKRTAQSRSKGSKPAARSRK
jgi:hypothetical protein